MSLLSLSCVRTGTSNASSRGICGGQAAGSRSHRLLGHRRLVDKGLPTTTLGLTHRQRQVSWGAPGADTAGHSLVWPLLRSDK